MAWLGSGTGDESECYELLSVVGLSGNERRETKDFVEDFTPINTI